MKKIFTLCFVLAMALAVSAQSDFPLQFADKDGNVIADGSTLNITEAEVDDFTGEALMPSGLFAKNTSDEEVQCGGSFTVQSMSSGVFQSCFPGNCQQAKERGDFSTQNGALAAGELKNMMTEWLPAKEGSCVVVYQLVTYKQNVITKKWMLDKLGPKVTLNFVYGTAGIKGVATDKQVRSVAFFDMQGRQVDCPVHGMYVMKTFYADGTHTAQKQFVR